MTNRQNKDYKQSIRKQSKQIKAQEFVMNNLRNGIDYLKEHCSKNSADSKYSTPIIYISCDYYYYFLNINIFLYYRFDWWMQMV